MRKILSCAAMAAMMALAWNPDGATAVRKKAPAKKAASQKTGTRKAATGKRSPASATAARKAGTSTASSRGKKGATKRPATTWRNRQTTPTPDRYREIQGALAAKGYLKPEDATGSWNQTSADAMKRFQTEQNLESNGKINSLSLIALGLGPRRDAAPVPAKNPPQPPVQ